MPSDMSFMYIYILYLNSSLLCYYCGFKHLKELALVNCYLELGVTLRRRRYTEDVLCQKHGVKWNFRYLWEKVAKHYVK